MKIEKLPSRSFRIRKMYKGKMYSVTFEHKPTQKEAMQAMAAELDKVQEKHTSITALDVQLEINRITLKCSPKAVCNHHKKM